MFSLSYRTLTRWKDNRTENYESDLTSSPLGTLPMTQLAFDEIEELSLDEIDQLENEIGDDPDFEEAIEVLENCPGAFCNQRS